MLTSTDNFKQGHIFFVSFIFLKFMSEPLTQELGQVPVHSWHRQQVKASPIRTNRTHIPKTQCKYSLYQKKKERGLLLRIYNWKNNMENPHKE